MSEGEAGPSGRGGSRSLYGSGSFGGARGSQGGEARDGEQRDMVDDGEARRWKEAMKMKFNKKKIKKSDITTCGVCGVPEPPSPPPSPVTDPRLVEILRRVRASEARGRSTITTPAAAAAAASAADFDANDEDDDIDVIIDSSAPDKNPCGTCR